MKYRKKPVVIEAVHFDGSYKCFIEDIEPFIGDRDICSNFVLDRFWIMKNNKTRMSNAR